MRKHLSYYFWRVAVGVTIGLILMLFARPAHALSYDLSYKGGVTVYDNNSLSFSENLSSSDIVKTLTFTNNYSSGNNGYFFVISYSSNLASYNWNTSGDPQLFMEDFHMRINLMATSGSWEQCETQNNYIVCPTFPNKTYTGLRFYFGSNVNSNTSYFRFSVRLNTNAMLLSANSTTIVNNTNETAQNTKETNDLIKSDDIGDDSGHSSTFASWQNSSAQNGTITNLITLPITLYTSILNNINGSCSSFSLGSLYGSSLTMTCIQPSQYLGSTLWGVIDMLFSGFFIFVISKKMIKVFNNMSMLKEGDILD